MGPFELSRIVSDVSGPLQGDSQRIAPDDPRIAELAARYGPALLRFARTFLPTEALAQEAVQESWLAALEGLARFRGDCSLKSWIFGILANRARSRAKQEARSVPFSALEAPGDDSDFAARFDERGHWRQGAGPVPWGAGDPETPEGRALVGEQLAELERALAKLPPAQRAILILRDVEGVTAAEACNILEIQETHQRVLLHRARTALRRALEVRGLGR